MITSFVLMMMLVIDYINVQTKGIWNKKLQENWWSQIIFSAFLGVIPGCLGAFTVVSLFTHRIVGFAALVTAMIATFGDEAFVMFSMMPEKALLLSIIVFAIAIATGFFIHFFSKNKDLKTDTSFGFEVHHQEVCHCFQKQEIIPQLKTLAFERALLIIGFLLFVIFLITGDLGSHEWDWKRITFLVGGLVTLFIVTTVPDHFLKEHLWGHVIKKHLVKILLWTFAALFFIHFIESYLDVDAWIQNNLLTILIVAVLLGIIPESGPHLIFITLFINGTIPFSILVASSIVQDGHGALPLLAESKKAFFYMKAINIIVGLVVGLIGIYFM
ncbi:MAG: putative manganese transporter [Bacteroidota bacterium]|nr:putative manganese transporter [Bacteroidota bacterium]